MQFRSLLLAVMLVATALTGGWTYYRETSTGDAMAQAAESFLKGLGNAQRAKAVMPYADPQRVDWHFIPKEWRKGLQVREMTEPQRKAAHALLQTALSEAGYQKATRIMSLEKLLFALEGANRRWPRDSELYYFTLFGDPAGRERWGLSVEGHHLSLNFVVEQGKVISTTPQAMGVNPAIIKNENSLGFELGSRVLPQEESLAFELLHSLSDEQRKVVVIDRTALKEVRAAGEAQPPQDPPAGLAAAKLTAEQQALLRKLIDVYAQAMPESVAKERWSGIETHGFQNVHFAWAGASEPGIGHYYRVQGPTFVIEFVNTQPDAAGNPANHIHCLWRDMRGDFALTLKQ